MIVGLSSTRFRSALSFLHNDYTIKCLQMGDEEGIFHTAVSSRGPFGVKNERFSFVFKSK